MLADRTYTVSGGDPHVHFRVQTGSLNLVLDVTVGSRYNLTLVWNKHMTVYIKITRAAQVQVLSPRPGAARGAGAAPGLTPDPRRTRCAACAATTTGT